MRGIICKEDQDIRAKGPSGKRKSLHLLQPYTCSPMLKLGTNQKILWKIKVTILQEMSGFFSEVVLSETRKPLLQGWWFQRVRAVMKSVTAFPWEGWERYTTACCSPAKLPERCWIAHPLWPKPLTQCLGSEGWHRGNLFYLFPEMSCLPGRVRLAGYSISWIILPFIRIKVLYRSCFIHVTKFSYIFVCGLPGLPPISLSPSESSFF